MQYTYPQHVELRGAGKDGKSATQTNPNAAFVLDAQTIQVAGLKEQNLAVA